MNVREIDPDRVFQIATGIAGLARDQRGPSCSMPDRHAPMSFPDDVNEWIASQRRHAQHWADDEASGLFWLEGRLALHVLLVKSADAVSGG